MKRLNNTHRHQVGVVDSRERDVPYSLREEASQSARYMEREARLATSSWSNECYQAGPILTEQLPKACYCPGSSDEPRGWRREIVVSGVLRWIGIMKRAWLRFCLNQRVQWRSL